MTPTAAEPPAPDAPSRTVGQLITGTDDAPAVKATPTDIPREATAGTAFAVSIRGCLEQLAANESAFVSTRHPDNLHQTRVAWRRARAAMSLFRPLIKGDEHALDLKIAMREIVLPLGPARDADVLLAQAIEEGWTQRAQRALRGRRRRTYAVAVPLLKSPQWEQVKGDLEAWLAGENWLGHRAELRDAPARTVTDAALAKRYGRIVAAGPALLTMSAHDLHQIRIEGKKFRYGCEFFASLYAGAPGDSPADFAAAMSTMQDAFGAANDRATAEHILAAHGIPDDALGEAHSRSECVTAWESLMALRPFWADPAEPVT